MISVAETRQRIVDDIALTERHAVASSECRNRIVMVHGGCHGSWQWKNVQSWFGAVGWASTAFDWRSHGCSVPLERAEWLRRDILGVTSDVEVACAAAQAASGGAPIVMGHSMGGLASLAYAASGTRDLAALVLLTPVVPRQFGWRPIELDVDFDRPWGPPHPETARQLFYSDVDDVTASRCYERLQPESPAAVWQATRWTAEIDVSRVQAPTLVVAAGQDALTPPDYVLALARSMAADEILLPGVGHGVTLDPGWRELCTRIEDWLTQVVVS